MKLKLWKVTAVILIILIVLILGLNQSFSSYSNTFFTQGDNSSGTVIVVAAEGNLMVHGRITVSFEGQLVGQPHVILPNGTEYTVHSELLLNFSFSPALYSGGVTQFGGPANISISPSQPIEAGVVTNVSSTFLQTAINSYKGYGINYYAIFIQNYSMVNVAVVGGF